MNLVDSELDPNSELFPEDFSYMVWDYTSRAR